MAAVGVVLIVVLLVRVPSGRFLGVRPLCALLFYCKLLCNTMASTDEEKR